jgi:hypothetical protein
MVTSLTVISRKLCCAQSSEKPNLPFIAEIEITNTEEGQDTTCIRSKRYDNCDQRITTKINIFIFAYLHHYVSNFHVSVSSVYLSTILFLDSVVFWNASRNP